jgi:4-hydroxy-tetrahydrodipicolinate reductase
MTRLVIIGAAGRMGRRLVSLALEDAELGLAGAIERPGHPLLGQDVGILVTGQPAGVAFSCDLAKVLPEADVVIDFSAASAALPNTEATLAAGKAVVLGTTGLTTDDKARLRLLAGHTGRLVVAPNFSVGVNALFALCRQAAAILGEDYAVEIVEMHHDEKKDAPSGTAERLGEVIAEARAWDYQKDTAHGRYGMVGARPRRQIGMHSLRGGDVVGDHTVIFATGGERIELSHKAGSRDTFVRGALRAAKFIHAAKPGIYDMGDVLGLPKV